MTAVVLNLIPLPPFDGYAVLAPFLNGELRARIAQASSFLMLLVFVVLWYVPVVNSIFWRFVGQLSVWLQIPLQLAIEGLSQFQFWR